MSNAKNMYLRRFKDEKFKKIIVYRNPSECTCLKLERINPDHVGIIWGRRDKRKNKGSNFIKLAKVYFYSMPVMVGITFASYLDAFTNYVYMILLQIGIYSAIVCIAITILYYCLVLGVVKYDSSRTSFVSG